MVHVKIPPPGVPNSKDFFWSNVLSAHGFNIEEMLAARVLTKIREKELGYRFQDLTSF